MKKTSNLLMMIFATFLLVAGGIYLIGDFCQFDMSVWEDASKGSRFFVSTLMILLTIAIVPLSLRLFKFERVRQDIICRREKALKWWGILRIFCLGGLLVLNTFLYYGFGFESTYGYLAVVVLLCMPFIIPTLSRCVSETSNEEFHEEADSSDSQL